MIKKEKPSTKCRYKVNIPQYMTGPHLTSYCGGKFKAFSTIRNKTELSTIVHYFVQQSIGSPSQSNHTRKRN